MTDIHPYSNLTETPTDSVKLYAIDDRGEVDGAEIDLDWGTDEQSFDNVETSDGEPIPESDAYLYSWDIADLDSDTTYYGEIDGVESVQWTTLPESGERDVTVLLTSDLHSDTDSGTTGSMTDPDDFGPLVDTEPDIVQVLGDYLTFKDEVSTDAADFWIRYFREYYSQFNQLVPIFSTVGNHEVGNHQWDGTTSESVDPDEGYFSLLYANPRDLDGPGNSGAIKVNDDLQLIVLDTHSAYPEDVGDWLEGAIDESASVCLPVHHAPLMQLGDRDDNDLEDNMRREWAKTLYEADNIYTTIGGHTHVRGRTVPWKVVDSDPNTADSFDLGDGWLVEAESIDDGLRMWGDGYRANRDLRDEWYIDRVTEAKQFYSVEIGNPTFRITEHDENGNQLDSEQYLGPRRIATIGDATLGHVTFGGV